MAFSQLFILTLFLLSFALTHNSATKDVKLALSPTEPNPGTVHFTVTVTTKYNVEASANKGHHPNLVSRRYFVEHSKYANNG